VLGAMSCASETDDYSALWHSMRQRSIIESGTIPVFWRKCRKKIYVD